MNLIFAAFLESTILVGVTSNPFESESIIKRVIPALSPGSLEVLVATINLSAKPPSKTKDFSPFIM